MTNKTEDYPVAEADYKPMYVRAGRNGSFQLDTDPETVSRARLEEVDALFHYFVEEEDPTTYANEDRDLSQGEAIAKLITRKYHDGVYIHNSVARHEAPVWTTFRNQATFISGDIIDGAEHAIERWLRYHHGDDVVIIDGSRYDHDSAEGSEIPAFDKLMHLANNQRSVIEEGVIRLYPNHTREAMRFLNAEQYEDIEDDAYGDTKWLAEGRILSSALVDIPEFQKNFNLLVIKGVARYIHANQLNLNGLYRLFAKLGRANTRFVFLG